MEYIGNRRGLTLVELVITMAMIAFLSALMIPSLGAWLSHYRIRGVAGDIASLFRLAQITAVKENQTSSVQLNVNDGSVQVVDGEGVTVRTLRLEEYRVQFNGLDFTDMGGDGLVSVIYNTRGIPTDEAGNPLTPPVGQAGERIFLVNNRGERYWVEVTPVGNVRFDRV